MKDELVSFETAKLAKEKGFDIYQPYRYDDEKRIYHGRDQTFNINAPTQSLLQKWLREVHNIHIQVHFINNSYLLKIKYFEKESIVDFNIKNYRYKTRYKTYEEALEVALLEALKLIKEI